MGTMTLNKIELPYLIKRYLNSSSLKRGCFLLRTFDGTPDFPKSEMIQYKSQSCKGSKLFDRVRNVHK